MSWVSVYPWLSLGRIIEALGRLNVKEGGVIQYSDRFKKSVFSRFNDIDKALNILHSYVSPYRHIANGVSKQVVVY